MEKKRQKIHWQKLCMLNNNINYTFIHKKKNKNLHRYDIICILHIDTFILIKQIIILKFQH